MNVSLYFPSQCIFAVTFLDEHPPFVTPPLPQDLSI